MIGLLGKKFSGKSTVADMMKYWGYKEVSHADSLKNACIHLFNLTSDQVYKNKDIIDPRWEKTPRQLLQIVGTDLLRQKLPYFGINDIFIRTMHYKMQSEYGLFVVSDCRFQDEVDSIKKSGGKIIKIVRNVPKKYEYSCYEHTVWNDDHISETGIDSIVGVDYVIDNDGTLEQLRKKIDDIIVSITSRDCVDL